jgi:hypothetical protein
MDKHRGISVSTVSARLLDRLVNQRLERLVSNLKLRAPTQCGFRPGCGTLDALYTLQHLTSAARHARRLLFVVFVDFKKAFEQALLNRKSVIFAIAKTPAESDVQISGVIKKYIYSEKDPIKPSASAATLILDAATTENFVEMEADFKVVDTKSGDTVWEDKVSTYIKKMMTPGESVPLIYEKLSRNFLAKSFGKPK